MLRDLALGVLPTLTRSHLGRRAASRLVAHPAVEWTWREIVEIADRDRPALVSVDVFDTVVVRPLVDEASLHEAIATSVGSEVDRSAVGAYVDSRLRPTGGGAPSIEQIFGADAMSRHHVDASHEIEFECATLRPVPEAVAGLNDLRRAGLHIQFTSDMHLSAAVLGPVLERLGVLCEGDDLVVSSDIGRSKSDGDLFADLGTRGRVLHVGDQPWADVVQAAANGVRPLPVRSARPTRYESLMAEIGGVAGSIIAGASRTARLSEHGHVDEQARLFDLGAQIPGQAFLAFLFWVRHHCEAQGIRQIAFLSRDGELPLRMAEAMPADHWEGFELRYLQCSRRVWQQAAVDAVGVDSWVEVGTEKDNSFINHYRHEIPFRSLLDRVGLQPADLPVGPLRRLDPDTPLPDDDDAIGDWEALLDDVSIRELIRSRSLVKEREVVDFLRQEGIGEEPVAMVDIGWRGQLAWMVSALTRKVAGHEPLHLHFGGEHVRVDASRPADILRFALDDSVRPHPVAQPVAAVEVFSGSGKARLVGYERTDDGIVLRLDRPVPAIDSPARHALWDGAIECARSCVDRSTSGSWGSQWAVTDGGALADAVRALLDAYWNRPSKADVRTLSHLYLEADDAGLSVCPFVGPYTVAEILGARGGRRMWSPGSLMMTWRPFRDVLKLYFAVRDRRAG